MKSPARTTIDGLLSHLADWELESVAAACERLLVRRSIAKVARERLARLRGDEREQSPKPKGGDKP